MRRFALRGNIDRYRALLSEPAANPQRDWLRQLLAEAERELRGCSDIWNHTCPHLQINTALGQVLEIKLDTLVTDHQASYGNLHIWDGKTEALYLVAQSNFQWQFSQDFSVVHSGDGSIWEKAASYGKSIFVEDMKSDRSFRIMRSFASENGIHAIQSTPILSKSRDLLGVFSTYFSATNPFAGGSRDKCQTAAHQVGSILESSRWA